LLNHRRQAQCPGWTFEQLPFFFRAFQVGGRSQNVSDNLELFLKSVLSLIFGKCFGHVLANFVAGCLFFGTKMMQQWSQNPETVISGPHRWPRGVQDGIFEDFWIIFGVTLGTLGTHVSALVRAPALHPMRRGDPLYHYLSPRARAIPIRLIKCSSTCTIRYYWSNMFIFVALQVCQHILQ